MKIVDMDAGVAVDGGGGEGGGGRGEDGKQLDFVKYHELNPPLRTVAADAGSGDLARIEEETDA